MVYYLQGIFLPQTHKTRSGYYLNHDILMSGINIININIIKINSSIKS
jgi:hypothetical protein